MGCEIAIWLELDNADAAQVVLQQAQKKFAVAEYRFTRFYQSSELSRLNAQTEQWVSVSKDLWDIVVSALKLARETDGLFDPTLLNAIQAAGYTNSFEQLNSSAKSSESSCGRTILQNDCLSDLASSESIERIQDEALLGGNNKMTLRGKWQDIQLDTSRQSIWLPQNVGLDLGGIGKGWTAQKVVKFLNQFGPCLVDAGGDITAGDGPAGWPGWSVGIAMPTSNIDAEDETFARLWLCNGALATSGIDYRRWQHQGKVAHHLIDPRSGQSAETDLTTISVLATDSCTAEAWATAALIAGSSLAYKQLSQRQIAAACMSRETLGMIKVILTKPLQPLIQYNCGMKGRFTNRFANITGRERTSPFDPLTCDWT